MNRAGVSWTVAVLVLAGGLQGGEPAGLVIDLVELNCGGFSVRVPGGTYEAGAGGAANYTIPAPIAGFKGPDGVWRGHGYLETYARVVSFEGRHEAGRAELVYRFDDGGTYRVKLTVGEGVLWLDERSELGPRDVWVFDTLAGGWAPRSAFAFDVASGHRQALVLPGHYDKQEVVVNPVAARAAEDAAGGLVTGVVVLSGEADQRDAAAFWCDAVETWEDGDRMGFALWQRRQRGGDASSRHFQAPETKTDSTPNPRTAGLLGPSLYEGRATLEFNLGKGSRRLGFAVFARGDRPRVLSVLDALLGFKRE